jgi:hypothetical protein
MISSRRKVKVMSISMIPRYLYHPAAGTLFSSTFLRVLHKVQTNDRFMPEPVQVVLSAH